MSYQAHTSSDQATDRAASPPAGALPGAPREPPVPPLRRLATQQVNGAPFRLVPPDGNAIDFGRGGEPKFILRVVKPEGLDALASVDALNIAHAYMDGQLDFE